MKEPSFLGSTAHLLTDQPLPWLRFIFQHSFQVLPCHGGPTVPLHLAAHLHPRAAAFHDRHRVLAHPLPHRPALQLLASPEGAPSGGGEPCTRTAALLSVASSGPSCLLSQKGCSRESALAASSMEPSSRPLAPASVG